MSDFLALNRTRLHRRSQLSRTSLSTQHAPPTRDLFQCPADDETGPNAPSLAAFRKLAAGPLLNVAFG
jgi:hypothetical protein